MCSNVTHLHYEENCLTEQTLVEACEALLTNFPKPRRYPLLPRCTIRWRKCKPWWERSPEFESKSKVLLFKVFERNFRSAFERSKEGNNWERNLFLFKGPFPASFSFIFVYSTINSKYVHFKFFWWPRFKLRTFGIGSNRFANCTTTTAMKADLLIRLPVKLSCICVDEK